MTEKVKNGVTSLSKQEKYWSLAFVAQLFPWCFPKVNPNRQINHIRTITDLQGRILIKYTFHLQSLIDIFYVCLNCNFLLMIPWCLTPFPTETEFCIDICFKLKSSTLSCLSGFPLDAVSLLQFSTQKRKIFICGHCLQLSVINARFSPLLFDCYVSKLSLFLSFVATVQIPQA